MESLHVLGFEDFLPGIPNPGRLLIERLSTEEGRQKVLDASGASGLVTTLLPVRLPKNPAEAERDFCGFKEALNGTLALVKEADFVLALGQHLPRRDIRWEERARNEFSAAKMQTKLEEGGPEERTLSESLQSRILVATAQGTLTGGALVDDISVTGIGSFYCNALAYELMRVLPDRGIFGHMATTTEASQNEQLYKVYGGAIDKFGLSQGGMPPPFVSTEDNFEAVCSLLRAVRSTEVRT